MKNQINFFFDKYLNDNSKRVNHLKELILKDLESNDYNASSDFQLCDISYDYNLLTWELSSDTRFSYFGSTIKFLSLLKKNNFIDNINLYLANYLSYKNLLKEKFITYSFVFKNWELELLKYYFDIFFTKSIASPAWGKKYILENEVVLLSSTFKADKIIEKKIYYPVNKKLYAHINNLLENNGYFQKIKEYFPFDILFRMDNTGMLKSLKIYYRGKENEKLFDFVRFLIWKKKPTLGKLNIKEEVWIDFDLKWWINKISYYVGLYK